MQLYVRRKVKIKPNLPSQAKVYLKVRRSLPERAERWAKLGFSVAGEGDRAENVVFCAPPSGTALCKIRGKYG